MSTTMWYGSEESADLYLTTLRAVMEKHGSLAVQLYADEDDEEDKNPVKYSTLGNGRIALIETSGPTIARITGWSRYYGIVSYDDIKERFAEAAVDANVKLILHKIDSQGGAAAKIKPLGQFIREVSNRAKPVVSFSEGTMASAALWYGTAAGQVVADEDAEVGSLGAIAVHMEFTEALKNEGVAAKVFRTAPFKALGHPYEKLTPEAEKQIMDEMMVLHNRFVSTIAEHRKLDAGHVNSKIANGKVFQAPEAKKLGLIDQVMTFEQVVAKLLKLTDNSHT